jgi:DNA polymerase III epsilon subunit-like protein
MKLTQKPLPKYGFGIDWETSGSAWGEDSSVDYQGVSFGAVVFDLATFEVVDTLYREIKFDESKYKWTAGAEKIHGLSREHLAANGVSSEDAAVDLMTFFTKYFAPDEMVFVIGHHCEFDEAFSRQLLEPHGIMYKAFTRLDTAGAGLINFGIHKSNDLFDFLGLPPRTTHNALEDIVLTVQAAKMMRTIVDSSLGL